MFANDKNNIETFLHHTRTHLETLINGIPLLSQQIKNAARDFSSDQVDILEQIPLTITFIHNKPVVTIAFCGPSGAGKSTIFNLLTSLGIPAGGAVRPMTHASLAVAPDSLYPDMPWAQLFPGFELENFSANADLRNPASPANRLFTGFYPAQNTTEDFWPCIIDVPDFNTTSVSNWEKADHMLKRADSAIFTVYHESYKSQKTFSILKKVLLLSGSVVYLLTKLDHDQAMQNAREIWADILQSAEADPDFQQKRSDGTTLIDFLRKTPFYFSPYVRNPSLLDIKPLSGHNPSIASQIFGQKGLEVLLSRQLQAVATGIATSEAVCRIAEKNKKEVSGLIYLVNQQLEATAQRITGEEFPVFHILAMIRKLLEESRPTFLKRAFKPILMLGSGLKAMFVTVKNAISNVSRQDIATGVLLRNELERARLQKEVERLMHEWRNTQGLKPLPTDTLRNISDQFLAIELPPVDSEWEKSVNESLREWQSSNKNLWLWFNVVNDILVLFGSVGFLADFLFGGGMGTLGIVAVIGGSSATGGMLLSLFNNMGLGNQILQAHKSWKKLRQKEYINHLQKHFAGPLFLEELNQIDHGLDAGLINSCTASCDHLKEIIRQNEQTPA